MGVTPWPQARQIAREAAPPAKAVEVPLSQAVGRRLVEPLWSLTPLPAFDTAAMDGYAVRGPGPWQLVGRVLAGGAMAPAPQDGQAVEVATGAQVPPGCDGVLPYERGVLAGDELTGEPPSGRHVRWTGEECPARTPLLPAGTPVSPAAVGLAAATGHETLLVQAQLRIAAVITGDELLRSGLPGDGRVRDAIGPLLASRLELASLQHLPDDPDRLRRAVEGADADVVITTGASSVGRADFLPQVLGELHAEVLVDGVAVKPGHPQVLARLADGRLLVGLPGNPLAALCALATLVVPLLGPVEERAVQLTEPLDRHPASHRLVPVRVMGELARPTGHGGSAMLRGAAVADGFAVLEPGREPTRTATFTVF